MAGPLRVRRGPYKRYLLDPNVGIPKTSLRRIRWRMHNQDNAATIHNPLGSGFATAHAPSSWGEYRGNYILLLLEYLIAELNDHEHHDQDDLSTPWQPEPLPDQHDEQASPNSLMDDDWHDATAPALSADYEGS